MSYSSDKVKSWRTRCKDRMVMAMGGKCQCCGYDKCNRALAFHHIDMNEKDFGFGNIRSNPKQWAKIVSELKKCILVCHNCHSEIHEGIRSIPKNYHKFNDKYLDFKAVAEYDQCPVCDNEKPMERKFCSHKCAQKNSRKVDWNSIDLLELLKVHKIKDLEKMLGVSNAAIYKRRDILIKAQNEI